VSIVCQIGSGVAWINVYIDSKYFKSSPPNTFSWDSTTVSNGTHTISANAYNSSGTQIGTSSVQVEVNNGSATTTPIQHVLVIVAENRSFDHLFATYTPKSGQTINNLLSEGIVTATGGQGPNYSLAVQQQATDQNVYSVTPTQNGAYTSLPPPNTTYANGLPQYTTDTRFPSSMPAGPYQISQSVPDNGFTGDPVHRFFQMWQQYDGGKMDLFAWVPLTAGLGPQSTPTPSPTPGNTYQGDLSMGYYNMAAGDVPHLKSMADEYAIGDNYHQGLMGGTGPELFYVRAADMKYYNDGSGNPIVPPANLIENPNPQSGTNNFYSQDGDPGGTYVDCSDTTQPGVAPIMNYLSTLPYPPFNGGNCAPNHYYFVNNVSGTEPSSAGIPTITSALVAKGISQKTYGVGWGGVDISQLSTDIQNGALAAVSFAKPNDFDSGHPAFSTPSAFEDWVTNLMNELISNPTLFSTTAVFITFDEGGGYYDSGYVQVIDFFGDGPRIPMIVISPYAKAGFVDHTYYDHASVLKFIEANWKLGPLSTRSRDSLPNPTPSSGNPYVPSNAPALGNMMNMFDFTNLRTNPPLIQ
jgi:phospholipase C